MGEETRILIVDDDPDIAQAFKIILECRAYQVTVATNGEECLQRIRSERPDLVILDLLMPRLDGFAVIRELRENPLYGGCGDVPVLVLTALQEDASRRRYELETGLQLDADEYVEKPIKPTDLLVRVTKLLERGRAARE
jgi:two-component system alkaline phosphatase synthesis response regulator PhoP